MSRRPSGHGPARRRARPAARLAAALALALPLAAAAHGDSTELVAIPGGTYTLGSAQGAPSARPVHQVELAPFRIAVTEVTNAAYADYLNGLEGVRVVRDAAAGEVGPGDLAGRRAPRLLEDGSGGAPPLVGLSDTDARVGLAGGRFVVEAGYARHPVTEVTWHGAVAYCASLGRRLPTEAEWEAAARGREGRRYPWGDAPVTAERAVHERRRGDTAPVGTHPEGATPRGVHDMAGNLAEWTHSLYRPYPYDAGDGREDPDARGERVTRGGDYVFDTVPARLTAYFRDGFSREPDRGHRHIGFRCAADAG